MTDRGVAMTAQLLGRRLGLRVDGSSHARLVRVLRQGAARAGCTVDDYAAALHADATALQELVDRVTVQETSFFRHPDQFELLARELRGRPHGGVIWSAGCATGQEAWSVAMLLAELGLDRWSVVATDISEAALEHARAGEYGERQLRGLDAARQARFLRADGDRMTIVPGLRKRVRFAHHNLVNDDPPADFDGTAVLCRNVLIYLHRAEADGVLARLRPRMRRDGLLLIGAAETLQPEHPSFLPERHERGYAWRPRSSGGAREADVPRLRPVPDDHGATGGPGLLRRRSAPRRPAVRSPERAVVPLPTARDLVAAGEEHAAAGRPREAAAAFRKAAYLRPDDALAHVRLALALEAGGDAASARRAFRAGRLALRRGDPDALAGDLGGWSVAELERLLDDRLDASEAM